MLKRVLTLCLASAVVCVTTNKARGQSLDQKLVQLEREFADADVHRDATAIERLEAADYVFTAPDGNVTGKAEDVNDLKTGNFVAEAIDLDELKVHVYQRAAIVTGKVTLRDCRYHGRDVSGIYRFTDVWADTDGQWRIVASQSTALMKQ